MYEDRIPEDPETREDYGFHRCQNGYEKPHLLGLYAGLFKVFEVKSDQVHEWRLGGILPEKIVELFSTLPEGSRGGYYPWFLRHKYILEPGNIVTEPEWTAESDFQQREQNARRYLDPEDRKTPLSALTLFAKKTLLLLLQFYSLQ